jgi:hypothetical protein
MFHLIRLRDPVSSFVHCFRFRATESTVTRPLTPVCPVDSKVARDPIDGERYDRRRDGARPGDDAGYDAPPFVREMVMDLP